MHVRILLISGSLPPMKCGVGDYTANLARALARRENTSVAVLTDVAATPIPPDLEFEIFPIAHGWRMLDVLPIVLAALRWRPDVIHIQYPTQGYGRRFLPWLLPALFRLLNVPVVQTWHEYHLKGSKRNILNAVLAGGLVVVRPNYKNMMPAWYRWLIRRKHIHLIPNASAIPRLRLTDAEKSTIRLHLAPESKNLIVYFGFVHPAKRVELLFEVADPAKHHLVLICDLNSEDAYHRTILNRIEQEPWVGNVTVTGFLPAEEAGRLLAAAAAVVLPFKEGGGKWNTSIHAAAIQGTFVLTTGLDRHGYDPSENIYYARPDDVADMRDALRMYISSTSARRFETQADWESIASAHMSFYPRLVAKASAR
jgi:glycosyltransferase involved in cell wall biosynthesis